MKSRILTFLVMLTIAVSLIGYQALTSYAALTFSTNKRIDQKHTGKFKVGTVKVTFDDQGATGWTISASDLSLVGVTTIIPQAVIAGGYVCTYDNAVAALFVYECDYDYAGDLGMIQIDNGDVDGESVNLWYMGY